MLRLPLARLAASLVGSPLLTSGWLQEALLPPLLLGATHPLGVGLRSIRLAKCGQTGWCGGDKGWLQAGNRPTNSGPSLCPV